MLDYQTKKFLTLNSPELELLILCSSPGFPGEHTRKINILINRGINWPLFTNHLIRHRLASMVTENLLKIDIKIPEEIKIKFQNLQFEQKRQSLGLASEIVNIAREMDASGIPVIFLKGAPLSQFLYDDAGLRKSRDIDILIYPDDIENGGKTLLKMGYQFKNPGITLSSKLVAYHQKYFHDYQYFHPEKNLFLEMHWRPFSNKYLYPVNVEKFFSLPEISKLANTSMLTMNSNETFLYLLVHGSVHKWFRLFWLRDVAEFIHKDLIENYSLFMAMAEKRGVIRSLAQGFLLSRIIYQTKIPEDINHYIQTDKKVTSLTNAALMAILSSEKSQTTQKIGRIDKPFYLASLRKDFAYKINCIAKLKTNSADWEVLRLPQKLFFLYYLLRPFLWFYRAYIKKK